MVQIGWCGFAWSRSKQLPTMSAAFVPGVKRYGNKGFRIDAVKHMSQCKSIRYSRLMRAAAMFSEVIPAVEREQRLWIVLAHHTNCTIHSASVPAVCVDSNQAFSMSSGLENLLSHDLKRRCRHLMITAQLRLRSRNLQPMTASVTNYGSTRRAARLRLYPWLKDGGTPIKSDDDLPG